MLACISTAQARAKCLSAFWADSWARHFSCKFPYKVILVKRRSAFRLRRLAQSVVPDSWARHFPVNFCIKWLLPVFLFVCMFRNDPVFVFKMSRLPSTMELPWRREWKRWARSSLKLGVRRKCHGCTSPKQWPVNKIEQDWTRLNKPQTSSNIQTSRK